MSNSSLQLSLPYIQGGQAQKHITHNEAIRTLDTVVQLSVVSQATAPDAGAVDGDRYIVAPGATDDFIGQEGNIAMLETGVWAFFAAKTGWVAYDESTGGQVVFNGNDWTPTVGGANVTATDRMGINATADTTNRLAVSSDASLLTHAGGGHQIKVNKATTTDTASLLFQTGWSGRAEMGTTGTDDFAIKVSADGSAFQTALQVDGATGAVSLPNTFFADPQFGTSMLTTTEYVNARGAGTVSNFLGHLGNSYNYPTTLVLDRIETPGTPGAFVKVGHYSAAEEMGEHIAIDPNRVYRTGAYLRQETEAGDWSAFANEGRHAHYMGFRCYDADGFAIDAGHHARFRHNGVDSLTTLTQPLAPGDTVVHVADATGWNESTDSAFKRGLVIFGYRDAAGRAYDHYSRIEAIDLFELGGVDKATGQITLNQPLPGGLANPHDANGVWPVGTRIANRNSGPNYKFGFYENHVFEANDTWYHVNNAIGGIDLSGRNIANNFPPGTATVRVMWLLNYSNRTGGWNGYPDTGAGQRTWVTGVSVDIDTMAQVSRVADGSCDVYVVQGDSSAGTVSFVPASLSVSPVQTV